jgi:site-specific DNA-methyltransferase (adenine-specific)
MKHTSNTLDKYLNRIRNIDCQDAIQELPDNCIDLVITSPPYNVDLGNNKHNKSPYDLYNDNLEHAEYLEWLQNIFGEMKRIIKSGGRVVINIGDGRNGAVPTNSDIIQMMSQELDYLPLAHIVWNKNQVGNRTSWGSFLSPSCPSFPTPFEHILVFAKDSRKLQTKGTTDLTKEEFIEWSLSMWTFAPERDQKTIGHPAMFPLELPKRCIKMFSWTGATVFDPFAGAGTALIAAKQLGRNFVGTEISKEYVQIAEKRIAEI